jgi:hypothetical protein
MTVELIQEFKSEWIQNLESIYEICSENYQRKYAESKIEELAKVVEKFKIDNKSDKIIRLNVHWFFENLLDKYESKCDDNRRRLSDYFHKCFFVWVIINTVNFALMFRENIIDNTFLMRLLIIFSISIPTFLGSHA